MPRNTFRERLEALAALLDPTRDALYRYVAAERAAVSRDQAAASIGISRAMAAFHLDRLVESGLLRAEYRRLSGRTGRGAGRPSKLYRRSRRRFGLAVPERDHELLARLLAQSMPSSDGGSSADEAAHRYGHLLGARARKRISGRLTAARRSGCVEVVLGEIGFEPARDGGGETRTRNCPFDPVSRQSPEVVCRTAIALVHGVVEGVAADGIRVHRDERPDRCCVVLRHDNRREVPITATGV